MAKYSGHPVEILFFLLIGKPPPREGGQRGFES